MSFERDDYDVILAEETPQAERLCEILMRLYNPESVSDVGCGPGLYLKPFLERDVECRGYEISEDAILMDIVPRGVIRRTDITDPYWIPRETDITICLEVLEHIDDKFSHYIISRLGYASPFVIFSAARPGQGGNGHINCQEKDHWQEIFEEIGFERNYGHEMIILDFMRQGYHMGWLTQNLMVFQET